MNRIKALVFFVITVITVSIPLYAQNTDYDYLQIAYESLIMGDCEKAIKFYNVYKAVEEKSDIDLEKQIEDCFDEKKVDIQITIKGITFVMKFVKGGTFQMGSSEEGEGPRHYVTLSNYYMGETEVTQALWRIIMGNNPSRTKGDNIPVHGVSWYDCQEFIRKLNMLTGKQFRLPTEAEWEYAARGGVKKIGYEVLEGNILVSAPAGVDMPELAGGPPSDLDEMTWYSCNSGDVKQTAQEVMNDLLWNKNNIRAHPIKRKRANELGLFDMRGNIKEWCNDWYVKGYDSNDKMNPSGPTYGSEKVVRGGSCFSTWYACRVQYRGHEEPNSSYVVHDVGLRLVLSE